MNSTLNATQLLMVPLAPLLGSALAGILGTALGGRRIGRGVSHSVTILGVFISLVISAMTLYSVAVEGARFNETLYTWMVVDGFKMEVGFLVDGLTAMMMCVVTFVSLMVPFTPSAICMRMRVTTAFLPTSPCSHFPC